MNRLIIFDCERMKYAYTGLYSFCKELGSALVRQNNDQVNQLSFYVPEKEVGVFGNHQKYLIQNHLHKFFPRKVSRYDIWHCTYQGSNYLPPKSSQIKIISTIHDLNFLHRVNHPQSRPNTWKSCSAWQTGRRILLPYPIL
ncbi:glycosyltransferase family protein [Niabella hibiscisoli]|uniref:hypothetical protein n=1 Tax=Niabella hibiscisoli TaxID=1825928 RepID=UPI001F0F510B|nr:hypothetical protein [Niabella hibiscisoli]MCH5716532.1 hypothetical protein [Niabella hibiscisoli]